MSDDRHNELELLRRILQLDIDDAVSRYEAETGTAVSRVTLNIDRDGGTSLELEAAPGKPHKPPPIPTVRMLIAGSGQ